MMRMDAGGGTASERKNKRRLATLLLAVVAYSHAACYRAPPRALQPPAIQVPDVIVVASTASDSEAEDTVVVAPKDTLYALSKKHRVAIRSLIDANGLKPPYTLRVGQRLRLPSYPEYVVQPGDTAYRISRCQGVDLAIMARLNGFKPPYTISVGQRLRIPARTQEPSCPRSAATVSQPEADGAIPAIQASNSRTAVAGRVSATAPVARPPRKPGSTVLADIVRPLSKPNRLSSAMHLAKPPARASQHFLWPVDGELVSRYGVQPGNRHNDGINIAAPRGTVVRAAENGVVVYAGNQLRGYGNLVLIRHADGWTTAYAHNEKVLVGRGDTVRRGQEIAHVGATGNVQSPQMHFELRRRAQAVDPEVFLAAN